MVKKSTVKLVGTRRTKLEPKKIMDHLLGYRDDGADVLGIYPLLADGTCRFLVFDFDNHEKVPKVRILPILMMNGMMKWML